MTYTIAFDGDDQVHVRAILNSRAEIQELVDKLLATKEKMNERPQSVSSAIPADGISDGATDSGTSGIARNPDCA